MQQKQSIPKRTTKSVSIRTTQQVIKRKQQKAKKIQDAYDWGAWNFNQKLHFVKNDPYRYAELETNAQCLSRYATRDKETCGYHNFTKEFEACNKAGQDLYDGYKTMEQTRDNPYTFIPEQKPVKKTSRKKKMEELEE